MAYKRVYAPSGEPFDVPEVRANDLILQNGWTQQVPVAEDDSKPKRRRKQSVETVVESAEAETPEEISE